MDDVSQAAPSPAPSPAKGKGKKNAGKSVKKTKKPAPKKGNRGRGRRGKVYEDPRVQAAYERQQDLAALYAEVSKAIKPALEEVADASIKILQDNPTAHQEVAEYEILQKQLDEQLEAAIAAADQEYDNNIAVAKRTFELDSEITYIQFHVSYILCIFFSRPNHSLMDRTNSIIRPKSFLMELLTGLASLPSSVAKAPQLM